MSEKKVGWNENSLWVLPFLFFFFTLPFSYRQSYLYYPRPLVPIVVHIVPIVPIVVHIVPIVEPIVEPIQVAAGSRS